MIELKDLLNSLGDLLISKTGNKDAIRKIIGEEIGKEISKKDIEIKNNIIYLNIKPIYKNEIFLKQEKILQRLEQELGKKTPTKIK